MSEPGYEHPNLTDEQKRTLAVGQCNYLSLMIVSLAAAICGSNAVWYCNFANREITFKPGFNADEACTSYNFTSTQDEQFCNAVVNDPGVGFYYWYASFPVDQHVCMSYSMPVPGRGLVTPDFDSAYEAARVFAVMASFFGFFGVVSILFASCCPVSQDRVKGLSIYFFMATLFQGLTFLFHNSNICEQGFINQYLPEWDTSNIENVTCTLGEGGKQSVAATLLYFAAALLAPVSVAPSPIGYTGQRGGDPNFGHPEAANYDEAAADSNA